MQSLAYIQQYYKLGSTSSNLNSSLIKILADDWHSIHNENMTIYIIYRQTSSTD